MKIAHHNQSFSFCTVVDFIIFQFGLVLDLQNGMIAPLENMKTSPQNSKQDLVEAIVGPQDAIGVALPYDPVFFFRSWISHARSMRSSIKFEESIIP